MKRNFSGETNWLRTIDATRKEENYWWKKADDIREHLSGGQKRQEKQTDKMGHETRIKNNHVPSGACSVIVKTLAILVFKLYDISISNRILFGQPID